MIDAGSVKGEFIIDDSSYKKATNNAVSSSKKVEKSFGGMTKSLFTAQLAYAAVTKAVTGLINVGKKSISAFVAQEKVISQQNAVLKSTNNVIGITSKELQNMASALQKTTTFGDEAVTGAQNLLLTFTKIGKDVFPQATEMVLDMSTALGQGLKESSIQLGKALQDPILGITALRRVGVNFSDSQKEMVKQLVESGNQLEAQKIILSELQTEFGGSAKAVRQTFGGALEYLKNVNGDNQEAFGKIISVIGIDFVNALAKGAESLNKFLTDSNKIATIGASFDVLKTVIKDIGGKAWEQAKKTFDGLREKIAEIIPKGKESSVVFMALAAAGRLIGIGFTIIIKVVGIVITYFLDLIKVWKDVILLGKALWEGLTGKGWENAGEAIKKIKDSYVDVYKDLLIGTKDVISGAIDEFKKFPDGVSDSMKELEELYEKNKNKYEESLKNQAEITEQLNKEMTEDQKAELEKRLELERQASEKQKALMDEYKELYKKNNGQELSDKIAHLEELKQAAIKGGENEKEVTKTIRSEISKLYQESFQNIASKATYVMGQIGSAVSSIFSTIQMFYDNDYNALVASNEAKLEELTTSKEEQLEVVQADYEQQQADLQASYDAGLISEAEYNAQKETLEKQKADKEAAITKAMDDKIAEQKSENLKKQNAEKKKAFEANKANQIATAWINFAIGAVAAFAQGISQLGPIAGAIIGGVMTALLLGVTIAQTVAISQQQFVPEKALGGSVEAGTTYSVNEYGQEMFTPGVNGYISPASVTSQITKNIESQSSNNKGMTNIFNFDGATISDQMDLESIANYVIDMLGRKLELA
jgi:hypothetical protein